MIPPFEFRLFNPTSNLRQHRTAFLANCSTKQPMSPLAAGRASQKNSHNFRPPDASCAFLHCLLPTINNNPC
jgi:hypothetical protein